MARPEIITEDHDYTWLFRDVHGDLYRLKRTDDPHGSPLIIELVHRWRYTDGPSNEAPPLSVADA